MSNVERRNNYHNLCHTLCEFMQTKKYDTSSKLSRSKCSSMIKLLKNRNYQELHHEICKAMFDQAEGEDELWIRIDEPEEAIHLENIEKYSIGEERPYYRISVMTQTMLDYDRMMLNLIAAENSNDNLDELGENRYATNMYRPFFFNFLIDIYTMSETVTAYI